MNFNNTLCLTRYKQNSELSAKFEFSAFQVATSFVRSPLSKWHSKSEVISERYRKERVDIYTPNFLKNSSSERIAIPKVSAFVFLLGPILSPATI